MAQTTQLFTVNGDQALNLPRGLEFDGREVFIRRDATTGDVVLSRRPADWQGFLEAVDTLDVPEDFLSSEERDH